jgi:probable rRNA maturation factor
MFWKISLLKLFSLYITRLLLDGGFFFAFSMSKSATLFLGPKNHHRSAEICFMAAITFHAVETPYRLKNKLRIKRWLSSVITMEGKRCGSIAIIHCSDDYLLKINKEHLDHDYFTDIVTFDYSELDVVSGDLFISIDRVTENAQSMGVKEDLEDLRVMVHGVLHLLGYQDKTPDKKKKMTRLEDHYLSLYLTF